MTSELGDRSRVDGVGDPSIDAGHRAVANARVLRDDVAQVRARMLATGERGTDNWSSSLKEAVRPPASQVVVSLRRAEPDGRLGPSRTRCLSQVPLR